MPEQENPTVSEEGQQQTPANPPQESQGENKGENKPDPLSELPEWAQREIRETRAEAANYRTRLRDAETRLAEAKTPEEFAAALADLNEKNAELARSVDHMKIVRKYELPDDLAAQVRGSTAEEMEAAAKVLAKYAKVEVVSFAGKGGGLNPTQDPDDEMDPRKLAQRAPRR
jgi:hypothetical protein